MSKTKIVLSEISLSEQLKTAKALVLEQNAKIAEQTKAIEEQKIKLANSKVIKTESEFFRNKDVETAKVFKNMSETIKFFEVKFPDFVKQICEDEKKVLITANEFHYVIARKLNLK